MKKVFSLVLVLCMVLSAIPVVGAATPDYVRIFDKVQWSIDDEGTLVIEEGEVTSYSVNTSWSYYGPFRDNKQIKKIIFPDNVKFIGDRVFEGCENLTEIVLPKNLEELEGEAFFRCNNIEKITISEENPNFKTVDGVLFDNGGKRLFMYGAGRKDTEYTIPEGTVEIRDETFTGNTLLEKVNFPETLETIKDESFKGCINLEKIELPESVTYIGEDAFVDCEKLSYIKMPPYVYLQNNPFYNTALYNNWANWDDYGLYLNKHLLAVNESCVIKPDTISIAGEVFSDMATATSVTVPGSVICIGDGAFSNNPNIQEVRFEEGLEILGHKAFYDSRIKSVTLPDSLTVIGGEAFMHSDIESIVIPDNVIDIGERAFECCDNLESVTFGKSLGNIASGAFRTCHKLKDVTIPDNVWKVGSYAFYYCSKLEKISIGSGMYEFDESMLSLCNNLKVIEVSENNPFFLSKDNVMFDKTGERLVYYASGKEDAHYIVPDGVTVIGEKSINGGNFSAITIPGSVKVIESSNNPSELKDIYYLGTKDEWEKVEIDLNNSTINNAIVHFSDGGVKNIYGNLKCREEEDIVYITGLIDKTATEISIPGEINGKRVEIAVGAFKQTQLVTVNLDEKINLIPIEAFLFCTKLENINLDNVEYIGNEAFRGCTSLKDINLLNIKGWAGIGEERLNIETMKMKLIKYQYMIGYDPFSIYTVFYDAKIENLRIKWPEENFVEDAKTFPALFLRCDVKNVVFENYTISPSLAEFCGIDPSRRIKSVDPYVDLVKVSDELVIYGNSDEVKNYAEKIGVMYQSLD